MFAEQRPRMCNENEAHGIVTRHYLLAATLLQRGTVDLRYLIISGCLNQLQSGKAAGKNE
jgi:hypothetical protein